MSHKVFAVITDTGFDDNTGQIRVASSVTVRDTSTNPATGFHIDVHALVLGTENLTQFNAKITDKIKADITALGIGHQITDQDIMINKFV